MRAAGLNYQLFQENEWKLHTDERHITGNY